MFAGKGQFFQNAYEEFVSAQEEAVAQLNVQRARNSRFAELLARVLKNFDEARLGFDALLLEPVQRLPRYLLLLKGIHTPFYCLPLVGNDALAYLARLFRVFYVLRVLMRTEYYKNLEVGHPDRDDTKSVLAALHKYFL